MRDDGEREIQERGYRGIGGREKNKLRQTPRGKKEEEGRRGKGGGEKRREERRERKRETERE